MQSGPYTRPASSTRRAAMTRGGVHGGSLVGAVARIMRPQSAGVIRSAVVPFTIVSGRSSPIQMPATRLGVKPTNQ